MAGLDARHHFFRAGEAVGPARIFVADNEKFGGMEILKLLAILGKINYK